MKRIVELGQARLRLSKPFRTSKLNLFTVSNLLHFRSAFISGMSEYNTGTVSENHYYIEFAFNDIFQWIAENFQHFAR